MNKNRRNHSNQNNRNSDSDKESKILRITKAQLINSIEALNYLFAQSFRPSMAFRLKTLAKSVAGEVAKIEKERIRLCDEYGTFDRETNTYKFGEKEADFQTAFDILFSEECEIAAAQIRVSEFGAGALLSAEILLKLDWLIIE